jgi:IS5 family transposase
MKKLFVARQPNLFEKFAFPNFKINEDYKIIDAVLEDEAIVMELAKDFPDVATGRNRTPIEQTLRFIVLKTQKQLDYRSMERTLQNNLEDRWFCKINEETPCFKTIQNQIARVSDKTMHAINDRIIKEAKIRKFTKGKKMRIDSTITESNIHYPTDSSLLIDAMRIVVRTVKRSAQAIPSGFRTFKRKIRHTQNIIRTIGRRNKEAREKAINELMEMGKHIARASKHIHQKTITKQRILLERIIAQTETVLSGMKVKERIVSIFETSARPFRKGKAGKKVEFGQEVQIVEDEQFITNWAIHNKPSDTAYFATALKKHKQIHGKPPREASADRGYWSPENQQTAKGAGVIHISIAKKGKKAHPEEETTNLRKWKSLQKWRAGGEAKISLLKRKYGLTRSYYQGQIGMALCVGAGVIACNLATFARMAMVTGP